MKHNSMSFSGRLFWILYIAAILAIILLATSCTSYQELFKKSTIKDYTTVPTPEGKLTRYNMSEVTIGNLPWKKEWKRIFQDSIDPMFSYQFPWDKSECLRENVIQTDTGINLIARADGTKAVLFSNFTFKYGTVRALIKLPDVPGAMSAFWLFEGMPELDVLEHCGQWNNQVAVTHHWGWSYEPGRKKATRHNLRFNELFTPDEQYYLYEVEITPYKVVYRINGNIVRVMEEGIPSQDLHIILNIGWGNYCDSPEGINEDAVMSVKWLEVYEK